MRRVAIIGNSGSGKSTLALKLGERTGLPVIHLDREYWRPGWTRPDDDEWLARAPGLLAGQRWIIDGYFGETLPQRIAAADTIVFLDLPTRLCVWRVIDRALSPAPERNRRGDLPDGCPEQLDPEFIGWVYAFRETERPRLVAILAAAAPTKTIVHLTSSRAAARCWTRCRGALEMLADRSGSLSVCAPNLYSLPH